MLEFVWDRALVVLFSLAAQQNPAWTEPFPPFRIAGNLYYVGSEDLASYLITTPRGLILINSSLEANVPLIRASIEKLGFKFTDVSILLISHAHFDHDAGSATIKRLTGAKYMVMDGDVSVVESGGRTDFQYGNDSTLSYTPTKVDRVLHDRDQVNLGGSTLVAHLTPGHTKGCTTWTLKVHEGRKTYDVVIIGSPNVNEGYRLVANPSYPDIASDYERTFRVLKSLPVDIFLGAHGSYFNLKTKYSRMNAGARGAFVDPSGYKQYVNDREKAFRTALAQEHPGRLSDSVSRVDSVIVIGEDRPVNINARDLAVVEPHLAADRRDGNHLLAGTILVSKMDDPRDPKFVSRSICAALASFDGGMTWSRHDFPTRGCGDPWVVLLPNGGAVFIGLVGSELVAFRSSDGGKTWNDTPVSFGRGHDHGTAGTDVTTGPFGGSVYVVSHQETRDSARVSRDAVFVARSPDAGATFTGSTRVIASNLPTFADDPVILSDGALVVPFVNYTGNGAERSDLVWSVRSNDGGHTFSVPRYVGDCGGYWGQLAVDESNGPFQDRLYWVCWDTSNRHILVSHSSDGGETWSEPVIVNRGTRPVQTARLAVNRHGVVAVSWYDSREDPRGYRGAFRCQHVFFSASLDGGRTFISDVKVSSAENCPITAANGEAGWMWPAGGEYHGLTAKPDGSFHLLWADSRDGIYQLRNATAKVNGMVRP